MIQVHKTIYSSEAIQIRHPPRLPPKSSNSVRHIKDHIGQGSTYKKQETLTYRCWGRTQGDWSQLWRRNPNAQKIFGEARGFTAPGEACEQHAMSAQRYHVELDLLVQMKNNQLATVLGAEWIAGPNKDHEVLTPRPASCVKSYTILSHQVILY